MAGDKRIIGAATHFGRQMKKERQAHGWTLQEFSVRTAYDGAHLSRIENGLRPPTRALALACDEAFPERHGWFLDYYEESRQWAEVPPGFRDWSEIEDKATHLQAWSPGIIHGLLQTEDYAAALLATMPGATDEAVTGRLRARMERQRRIVFRDTPPASCFIVDEAALHRLVGSPAVMETQMRQLTAVAALPHVALQVLPAIAHPATMSGFVIADNAAYAEHVAGGFVYTDQTVTSLHRLFDTLRAECYRASESAALIERTCRQWENGASPLTAGPTAETA
jgi:transcriptional regulator with XRE-family HTH domain